jgi:heme a synthase
MALARWLGIAAVGAVVAQGILGGITVLFFLPAPISAAHATLAQLFFCTIVSIALFTSAWWQSERLATMDPAEPRVHRIATLTVAATLMQLILGAAFRHKGFGIIPHLIGAVVVTGMIFWLAGVLRRRFGGVPVLRKSARVLHALIGLQLLLGGAAWWSRIYAAQFPQPIPVMVTLTVAHTVSGAIVLATTVLVMLACYRLVESPGTLAVRAGTQTGTSQQQQAAL